MPKYLHTETVVKQVTEEAAREAAGKAKEAQQLQANRLATINTTLV